MDETRRRERLISISDPATADLFRAEHRWCATCGEPLAAQAIGRPRVYCSKNCQQTAYRQRTSRRVLLGRIIENTTAEER